MIDEIKMRRCMKCRQEKKENDFAATPSKFFPNHRSLICNSCLEIMVPADNFGEVDRLCRYLDIPFDLNRWTELYEVHKEHTLSAYLNTLLDEHYAALQWADENERWRQAREENTIDEEIATINAAKMRKLRKTWSTTYTDDELLFLDDYYNQIIATQNVSTPILQSRARNLCELTLRVNKGIRDGLDVKKDMDSIENIIKSCNFTATNAKNAADFESVGELMTYYGKKGWHPKWHTEPQDSIDFMMQNIQNYLKRLVINEGNFAEQVDDRRANYNMTERLENLENEIVEFDDSADINYEGADEFEGELNNE